MHAWLPGPIHLALLGAALIGAVSLSAVRSAAAQVLPDTVRLRLPLAEVRSTGAIPASTADRKKPELLTLGGPGDRKLILRVDPVLLRRVVLTTEDLREATLHLPGARISGSTTAMITLYRLRHGSSGPDTDYDATRPVASAPLRLDPADGGGVRVPGLAAALRAALTAADGDASAAEGFVAAILPAAGVVTRPLVTLQKAEKGAVLEVTLTKRPNVLLFDNEVKPRTGVYTVMKDGHLFYGGRRLRLWGVVGYGSADRMRKMGFNAQRVWQPTSQAGGGTSSAGSRFFYTAESANQGRPAPHVRGDGSDIDIADKHFADLKAHGMFVMFAALTGSMPIEPALADDSFLAGGDDWPEWKTAMAGAKNRDQILRTAIFFDERLQRLKKQHAINLLNHVNPYTGKKYGEDEAIAIYEVWNENGFLKRVLENGFGDLPLYFQDKIKRQWNDWLRGRYKDEADLKTAWGALKPGESPGSVAVAPFLKQRSDYPPARAADLIRFLIEKTDAFHQDFRTVCRAQAPPGVGVNVAPFSFDTQYKPSTHWAYTSAQGDVNSFGMYFWDVQSQLSRPPGMYVIDSHTVEGKATVLYETNQGRPGSHRAEYPLRLAALASWQDWDGVFWHYWSAGDLANDESFLAQRMQYIAPTHFWTAVHQERDPVMTSALAVAGRIFLGGAVHPAPSPATYRVGRDGLFSYDLINGVGQRETTFARGSRLRFEPEAAFKLQTDAATPVAGAKDPGFVRTGDEILWDYANGRLIVDTPTAKVYVGQAAPSYRFRDGITLSGLSTPFVAWAIVSADGRPLVGAGGARSAFVTAQSDARNTGFALDSAFGPGSPLEQAKHIADWGQAPVVVDDADYTLSLPARADYVFQGYDFALRAAETKQGRDTSVLRVSPSRAGETPWMGMLTFSRRGADAAPVVDAGSYRRRGSGALGGGRDTRLASLPNPLPGVTWADSYTEAHKALRDGAFLRSAISPEQRTETAPTRAITVSETDILLGAPADIDVVFSGERMARIVATFRRPPSLQDAATALGRRFGAPVESRITGDQTREDRVRWSVSGEAANLEVLLTEAQGTLTLTYALSPSGKMGGTEKLRPAEKGATQ